MGVCAGMCWSLRGQHPEGAAELTLLLLSFGCVVVVMRDEGGWGWGVRLSFAGAHGDSKRQVVLEGRLDARSVSLPLTSAHSYSFSPPYYPCPAGLSVPPMGENRGGCDWGEVGWPKTKKWGR